MSLWKPRSDTYKTYFFSTFCRSIFTNACWIFGTSLFVKVSGSKGYSQLYFIASIFALSYYVFFATRGHRQKAPYTIYKIVLALALIASACCFAEPYLDALKPFNVLFLYCFVVSVMTVDLIGTTLGPIVLQSSVNPAIFRQVYQKIVSADVVARILAALLVWGLSAWHLLVVLYPIAWITLIAHYELFGITVWRMRVSELRLPAVEAQAAKEQPKPFAAVGSAWKFLMSNPLVRVAMIIMVWSTVTKFLVEYIVYQVADATFGSARQVASFLSQTTVAIYALSLLMHHGINKYLTPRMQLSSLLAIQPINTLLVGGLALLLPPFWPVVGLMVTYNIIHRSIQLPMSRQCMVPVPRNQRGTIVSLISIVVSSATIATTGIMTVLKNSLHLNDFLILLLVLSGAILFVITGLDSYYMRNMWSFFREARSGSWEEEQQGEGLVPAALDSEAPAAAFAATAGLTALQAEPLLASYAFEDDRAALTSTVAQHRELLRSTSPEERQRGLRICFNSGFPWFGSAWESAAADAHPSVATWARHARDLDTMFGDMSRFTSTFRRQIKSLAMESLQSEADFASPLRVISELEDKAQAEALIAALSDERYRDLRHVLIDRVDSTAGAFSPDGLFYGMFGGTYADSELYRTLLQSLPFARNSSTLEGLIRINVAALRRDDLSAQMDLLQHTLFADEYRLGATAAEPHLISSITELPNLSTEEVAIVNDMHLSFLKRSIFFPTWRSLLE